MTVRVSGSSSTSKTIRFRTIVLTCIVSAASAMAVHTLDTNKTNASRSVPVGCHHAKHFEVGSRAQPSAIFPRRHSRMRGCGFVVAQPAAMAQLAETFRADEPRAGTGDDAQQGGPLARLSSLRLLRIMYKLARVFPTS